MLVQWDRLNPREQYFNLLEAWLRFGRAEMVGERGSSWDDELLMSCLQGWKLLPAKGYRIDPQKPREDAYVPGFYRDFYLLALMDLFGLLKIEQPPPPVVTTWKPASIKHVPFGDAVFTLLADARFSPLLRGDSIPEEDEDEEEEMLATPRFGVWQPLFQPYFPEWRENLELPEEEPREGTFVFRVSLGKIWRLIAMPADDTLDDLMNWILRSVNFDNDHLYEFTYRDRLGGRATAAHPYTDEGPWADQVPIGTLPLEPGQAMDLVYDFGDNWQFTVKLERIEPPGRKTKARILETHGKAPEQYPNWDE